MAEAYTKTDVIMYLQRFQANVLEVLDPSRADNTNYDVNLRSPRTPRYQEFGFSKLLTKDEYSKYSKLVNDAIAALNTSPPDWQTANSKITSLITFLNELKESNELVLYRAVPYLKRVFGATNLENYLNGYLDLLNASQALANDPPKEETPKEVVKPPQPKTESVAIAPPPPNPNYQKRKVTKTGPNEHTITSTEPIIPGVSVTGQPQGGSGPKKEPVPTPIDPEFAVSPIKLFQNTQNTAKVNAYLTELFGPKSSRNIQITPTLNEYFKDLKIDTEQKILNIYATFTKVQEKINSEKDPKKKEALQTHLNSIMTFFNPPTVLSKDMYALQNESLYRLLFRMDKLYGTDFVGEYNRAVRLAVLK